MAIHIPEYFFEEMTDAQANEMFGVLKSLERLFTKEEAELLIQQTTDKFVDYEILETQAGHTFINTGTRIAGEYIGPAASTTETALELAQDAYDAAVLDAKGNVIYKYSTGQGAMGVEVAGGTTKYQATSLMSLDLGMVGAAVAPLVGVALGINLVQANPYFWEGLSMKLLPFCYDGTTKIPGWLDIIESALVPGTYEAHGVIDKAIYDAIKSWFEEEGYGDNGEYEVEVPTGVSEPLYWKEVKEGTKFGNYEAVLEFGEGSLRFAYFIDNLNRGHIIAASTTSIGFTLYDPIHHAHGFGFNAMYPYTHNNQTCYIGTGSLVTGSGFLDVLRNFASESASQSDVELAAWALIFGVSEAMGFYPEGTSRWTGRSPSVEPYGKTIVRYRKNPETSEIEITEDEGIEITILQNKGEDDTDPSYPSPDPNEEPDPDKTANPKNMLSNLDDTAPGNNVDPAQESQPEPEVDPSILNQPIVPIIPVDPPGPPGVEPPPPDAGSSPPSVLPAIPLPFSSTNDGLISVYHPTDAQLKAFASWLWVTYADDSIQKLWNNPFDGVIGLMEIYCTPTDIGSKTIRSGFLDSGISSAIISRYTEINCGTIFIPEYYCNYFDYSPYSKAHVYLPFIGIVELNVDDVVGHAINITYKIDEYNGSCIAQIRVAKYTEVNGEPVTYDNIMYQFSGNCAVELPLAGGTQSAIRAGMIQAAAYGLSSVVGGIVSGVAGNFAGGVSQVGYGVANAIGSLVSAKSSVQHSGSFGSSFGALGCKIPYIVISRPRQLQVYNYNELYGFPAHCSVTIGACNGFLRVREVNVRSATASDEEKAKIEALLKEGVYV